MRCSTNRFERVRRKRLITQVSNNSLLEGKKLLASTIATMGEGSPETVFPEDLHVMGSDLWRAAYAGANSRSGAKVFISGPDISITLRRPISYEVVTLKISQGSYLIRGESRSYSSVGNLDLSSETNLG